MVGWGRSGYGKFWTKPEGSDDECAKKGGKKFWQIAKAMGTVEDI